MEFVIFALLLIILDLSALYWGVDSRDEVHSPEWKRRLDRAFFF